MWRMLVSAGPTVRVVLADDHEVVRKGVRALFNQHPGWTVCGEAENGVEAVDLVRELQPELVVLDVSMPVMNGLQAAAKIRQLSSSTKIVMLSMHNSIYVAQDALEAGADVFLTKAQAGTELIRTISSLFGDAT
jgi:DNA-binding NarL/FixJ family response regulator